MEELQGEEEISQKKLPKIPKRFLAIAMSSFVALVFHVTKNLLRETLKWFLKAKKHAAVVGDTCNATITTNIIHLENQVSNYNWDESLLATLKLSHVLSYTITAFIGGILADKYGARRVILIIYLITSGWIGLCPFLLKYCGGIWQLLVAWSAILGLVQGPTLPALDAFYGQWIPFGSKTTAAALKASGELIGVFIRILMVRLITTKTGQIAPLFYIWFGVGLFMCFLWYCLCFSSPEEHPTVTEDEKTMVREKLGPYVGYEKKQIPWKNIFTSIPVWAFIINHAGVYWAWTSLMQDLRWYIKFVVKIDVPHFLFHIVMLPMILTTIFSISTALLCDYLIGNQIVDITIARRIHANFGSMGTGIFSVAMGYVSCMHHLALALFNTVFIFLSIFTTGVSANDIDLAPNFAGVLKGMAVAFGSICSLVMTRLLSSLSKSDYLSDWIKKFWISLGFYAFINTFFALASSGEEREWNIPKRLRQKSFSEMNVS